MQITISANLYLKPLTQKPVTRGKTNRKLTSGFPNYFGTHLKCSDLNITGISEYHPGTELEGLEYLSEQTVSWPRFEADFS
jgi:hypothetical protein